MIFQGSFTPNGVGSLSLLRDEVGTPGNDLLNLICYGFEESSEEAKEYGWFNYTAVEEEGQLKMDKSAVEENKHSLTNWIIGNTYKTMHDGGSLTTVKSKDYCMNYYTDVYPNMKETDVTGLVLDYSPVSLEIEAMNAVYTEFEKQLTKGGGGADKIEALYDEAMAKLKEAGLDKVKAEIQAQIDAYAGY